MERFTTGNTGALFFILVFLVTLSACFHENATPVANAGRDQEISVDTIVQLDGSNSVDTDGDKLSYQWDFAEKPADSLAVIQNPNTVNPTFKADSPGTFLVRLVVNDGNGASKPDFVHIITVNNPPSAKINYISTGGRNERVSLDASQSSDPEQQPLFYEWSFSAKPSTSTATIENPTSIATGFTPDQPGYYVIKLSVRDGQNRHEAIDIVMVEIKEVFKRYDSKPFADAGKDQPLRVAGSVVQLDGSASYDLDNDPLTYHWELLYKPTNSKADLANINGPQPSFIADIMGSYVIKLFVSDIDGDSHVDVVVVTPHSQPELACQDCHESNTPKGKPAGHIVTFDDCAHCHTNAAWKPALGGTHAHSHMAFVPACDVCHNGIVAKSFSDNHATVKEDCNYCHILSAWTPLISNSPTKPAMSHAGIFSGCADCHNNVRARGKIDGHMPTSDHCQNCHDNKTFASWASIQHLEHSQIMSDKNRCALCHK